MRLDDQRAVETLVGELGHALVPEPSPPPGYSITTTPGERRAPGRPLPTLSHGPCAVVRSRSVQRLAVALANHVRGLEPRRAGLVAVASAAIVADRRAILLPPRALWSGGVEPLLVEAGLVAVDAPTVDIDVRTSRVRARGWSWSAMSAVDVDAEVDGWLLERGHLDQFPPSRAGAVAAAASIIGPAPSDAQIALELVTGLASSSGTTPVDEPGPGPLRRAIDVLVGR